MIFYCEIFNNFLGNGTTGTLFHDIDIHCFQGIGTGIDTRVGSIFEHLGMHDIEISISDPGREIDASFIQLQSLRSFSMYGLDGVQLSLVLNRLHIIGLPGGQFDLGNLSSFKFFHVVNSFGSNSLLITIGVDTFHHCGSIVHFIQHQFLDLQSVFQ